VIRGRRSRAIVGGIGALALVAAALPIPATSKSRGFRAYVTCEAVAAERPEPQRRCVVDEEPVAVFIAKHQDDVRYKVCVKAPNGERDCDGRRTRMRGEPHLSMATVDTLDPIGRWRVVWHVPGKGVVARYAFRVVESNH
jgi:hypothetical protein